MFSKIIVLKIFAIFTEKQLCGISFDTDVQQRCFSVKYCEIFRYNFLYETRPVAASEWSLKTGQTEAQLGSPQTSLMKNLEKIFILDACGNSGRAPVKIISNHFLRKYLKYPKVLFKRWILMGFSFFTVPVSDVGFYLIISCSSGSLQASGFTRI